MFATRAGLIVRLILEANRERLELGGILEYEQQGELEAASLVLSRI